RSSRADWTAAAARSRPCSCRRARCIRATSWWLAPNGAACGRCWTTRGGSSRTQALRRRSRSSASRACRRRASRSSLSRTRAVRATAQARDLAQREGVDIRYYSIIYEVADDIEKMVRGRIAPKARERFLGYAEVRKVFTITKVGKVAGCMVTDGVVKRGAGVR